MILPYAYVSELTDEAHQAIYEEVNAGKRHHQTVEPAREVLKRAFHKVFPGEPVRVVQSEDSCIYSPLAIQRSVVPERFVEAQIRRETDQLIAFEDDVLFLDIETHNAERLYDMDRREFFRLGQYAWGEGQVQVTTDIDEVLAQIGKARLVYAHNGHNFDFNALLGDDALHLAYESKLFDTFVFAALHFPAPTRYLHSNGRNYTDYNTKPGHTARWLGLENLAFQFGFPGKLGNLQELAARHNPPKTKVADLDYGLIPLSDPQFLAYAEQDIIALRDLTRSMLSVVPVDAYSERAQFMAAIDAQMSRNGLLIDVPEAERRVAVAQNNAERVMADLVERFDFPTEGKQPWKSNAGKAAIERIMASYGITPDTVEWDRTASGALSFGKDVMLAITEGTEAEEVGKALALLQGQRPLAQQALECLYSDNMVHTDITGVQRSGRRSSTRPGLTTFDDRDKDYFIAEQGHLMIECDLSNSDARGVAAMSGDKARYKWFEPGQDGHEIMGRIIFGDDVYDSFMADGWESNTEVRKRNPLRKVSKKFTHGIAFNMQRKKLALIYNTEAEHLGLDPISEDCCQGILNDIDRVYAGVARWRANLIRSAEQNGFVTSLWGRPLWVTKGREFNQAVALPPQNWTTEVLYDGLIELYERKPHYLKYVRGQIHDAVLCSAPIYEIEEFTKTLVDCVYQEINGMPIILEAGHPAKNWKECQHGG